METGMTPILNGELTVTIKGDSSKLDTLKCFNKKKLISEVDKTVEELRSHFQGNKQPWDLDARSIIENILYDLMGDHISEVVYGVINERLNTVTEYKNGKVLLAVPRTYIYMNTENGKITTSKKVKKKLEYIGNL